ncbi:hypothetical protein CTI12_AA509590 [Artemisia annua]|uniref:Uncharacterized protein n=1 Tax=Artemisia annua TaxID=35608 RepID=A0A2U1LBG5_ARTAN|nr:hypothetical protein CTI12_AA509590 [Artemisia annua]
MSHTNGAVNMPNGFESVMRSDQGQNCTYGVCREAVLGGYGREKGLGIADAAEKGQVQPTAEAVENAQRRAEAEAKLEESEREALRRKHLGRHY